MNKRWRPLLSALLVTLLAVTLWRWHGDRAAVRLERKQAWQTYLRGPLSDLLYGSSRLRPLIVKMKLSKTEKDEARDAVDHLRRSSKDAQVTAILYEKDSELHVFEQAVQWHQEIFDLVEPWPQLVGVPLGREAAATERDLRLGLWKVLNRHREKVLRAKVLTQEEMLEMNALLYSLQE